MGFQSKTVPEEVLKVADVTVSFGGFKALNGLNFSLERGELRVVIGPNGAGKTTLLDVVTGKVRPTKGKVIFQPNNCPSREITRLPEAQIARLGIGRKFQTPNVFKTLTVLENLKLSLQANRGVLASLTAPFTQNGHGKERIGEIMETIGLAAKAHQLAGLLAHGEKQWLELGMVMSQEPELLLIDEPVAGMTPKESERTGELLMNLARRHTLLVIDHDMVFVRQIAMKVTVLHEGQILCQGTVGEVQRNPKVIEVYLGQDRKTEEDVNHRKPVSVVR
ncbi:urea ABC transporter ATP-binding protein UrtD [Planctomycetaceae bacterium SCGC AG-212-F19]|nr:urea ABC transporter ATP-binding protein UrtD [Planctomycetaceae bacterium SCGC AG-212-F19]